MGNLKTKAILKNRLVKMIRANNKRILELQNEISTESNGVSLQEVRQYNIDTYFELVIKLPVVERQLRKIDEGEVIGSPMPEEDAKTLLKKNFVTEILGLRLNYDLPF